jgi:hypothetical protein
MLLVYLTGAQMTLSCIKVAGTCAVVKMTALGGLVDSLHISDAQRHNLGGYS